VAEKNENSEKDAPKKVAVKKAAVKKVVEKQETAKKEPAKKEPSKKLVEKKEPVKKETAKKVVIPKVEPKKPVSIQLIFQAPDLPTPKVNLRSGKLAEEETAEAPKSSAPTRTRQRTKPETTNNQKNTEEPAEEKDSGSTRVAAKRQRRKDSRDTGRRRTAVTESEFLARRESVDRRMIVREKDARVQIGVLEDGLLVEHYVAESQGGSLIGNVYLGKVQNVLPSMEAAFVDIGRGRNAVLYSGEVDWEAAETGNQPRRIELALKSGDQVLVQVTKDPVGQKGARLTSQISLPGRFLVYVPGGNMSGISRKLPEGERQRLKQILKHALPEDAGVIVRTAAEGATEDQLTLDVERLKMQWENINSEVAKGKSPTLLHSEPDLLVKIIRDVFNEDFTELVVSGEESLATIRQYLESVAPELIERLIEYASEEDVFDSHRLGDQIIKALDRKVFLPSGGSLVIDRTEAMTVVDVNTGKFIGSGGNLEETVTKNNLEAAEELVRQLRLRDIGGIVVVDFIDMIQESNQELVRRRLLECLSRDRTKNQVGEITSLGLVQMTRKKIGLGLLETFSEPCDSCAGRGVVVHDEPRFKMPEVSENKRSKKKEKPKPTVVKKIVTAEQADAFKNVVNQIASAGHSSDEALLESKKEAEGKTELLNAVLDSLPEAQNTPKPKRRRATSAGKLVKTSE
jgi:ribonuclease E